MCELPQVVILWRKATVYFCTFTSRFLFPPILQCVNGHMECRGCYDLKPQCGKCHQKMVDVPAKFAEMITEQFNVQCSYSEKGCTESVAYKVNTLEIESDGGST